MAKNMGYLNASRTKESDEVYTPIYAVEPILKYLKPNSKILCPFDESWSSFVKVLSEAGHTVTYSHLVTGQNFFNYSKEDVKDYDYIISNPPFSLKDKVLKRLYNLGKPFMLLLPLPTLQGMARGELFIKYGIEILGFDARIGYHTKDKMGSPVRGNHFASVYFCWQVLPEKLIIESLVYKDIPLREEIEDEN